MVKNCYEDGPTIFPITLSGDSDKSNLEPTNYRLNNDIFSYKIQDYVQLFLWIPKYCYSREITYVLGDIQEAQNRSKVLLNSPKSYKIDQKLIFSQKID